MVIWNGWGILVGVFIFGCALVAQMLTIAFSGGDLYWEEHKWPFGVAMIVAGALSWFVGRFLAGRKARTLVDVETGEEVVFEPEHSLFFIRMHYWGPILFVLGFSIAVVDLVT